MAARSKSLTSSLTRRLPVPAALDHFVLPQTRHFDMNVNSVSSGPLIRCKYFAIIGGEQVQVLTVSP